MKKFLTIVIVLILLGLGACYFYLKGNPAEITITAKQINAELAEEFPSEKTYFAIFQLSLDNPNVSFLPDSNRVRVAMTANLKIKVPGQEKLNGNLIVTSGIRYDSEEAAVYLKDPVIDKVEIDRIPQKHLDKIGSIASRAAGEILLSEPIYRLDATDMKTKAAKLLLKNIEVQKRGVVVSLGL